MSMRRFMQLWLWTKVKTGWSGFGFAGNEGWKLVEGETNIVVMKPDMAARPPAQCLIDSVVLCSI